MKAAIVGCGKIADAHVEEIRKIPTAQLVAVCDLEPIMAEQLAVRYGIPRQYVDVTEMLERERPDVLHITTPPQSHLQLARLAFDAGCHVFLEKPVALSCFEVKRIVDAARASHRKLTVNYWPNFEVQALELRRLCEEGILGDPVHIESMLGYNLAGEFGMAIKHDPDHWVRRMPGMLFQNVLDHVLNKIVPFIDDEQPAVHACAYQLENAGGRADGLLDELRVLIRGAKVSAYATFSSHARPIGHVLRVYGTLNTAHIDSNARTIVLERPQSIPSSLGRLIPPFLAARDYFGQGLRNVRRFSGARFHFFDGMRELLTRFYSCIEDESSPPIAYQDIVRVSEIMEQVFDQVYPKVFA